MEKFVRLKDNSNRLRRLIRDYGEVWRVISSPMPMYCFNNEIGVTVSSLTYDKISNVKIIDTETVSLSSNRYEREYDDI